MDLNGKTIVITGGGQGLGRAMAIVMAKEGANLALIDLNDEPLAEAVLLGALRTNLNGRDLPLVRVEQGS